MLRYLIDKLYRFITVAGQNCLFQDFQGVEAMRKMKPFLQIAIIAIFALTVIGISTSVAAGHKRPHVTRNNNVMILEYDFEEPDIITEGDIDFVTINGFERYIKAGAPVIPVKPVEILVPHGMKIEKVTSKAIDTFQLSDTYRLSHGTKAFRRSAGPPVTPTKPNPEIFSMTKFWPIKHHDLVTVQTNRGFNIAHVNLFPLQYSPKAGKIRMATKMRLTVRFAGMDSHHRVKPTKKLREKLERKIENPDTMKSYDTYSAEYPSIPAKSSTPLTDPAGPYYGANYKYIVITNNSLAGISDPYSFQALCDSKTARGISAGIVTTDWIYANYDGTRPAGGSDNQTRIRNFLIDAYQTWGTEYALLGGDKDIIPARLFIDDDYGNDDEYDVAADLYYGCVDPPDSFDGDGDGKYGEFTDGPGGGEVDLTAEIFTGRAAVENASEVVNFVRKTLVYETTNDAYLNEAGTMGSWLGFGGIQEFTKPFAELIRLGSSLYLGHHTHGFEDASIPNARDFNVVTLYDEDWWNDNKTPYYDSSTAGPRDGVKWNWNSMGWSATDDLLPFLNGENGNTTPHLLYISDHGSPEWGMVKLKTTPTTYYNCDDLSKLHNTNPFFFYDDSCQVGKFDVANCFGEVITTMEHGAFACILNSRDGLGAEGNTLDSPSTQMTREFFHSVLGKGIFELGRAHQEAKESCIWRLGSIAWLRYVYYELNLFGDPELRLRVTNDETPLSCAYTCGDLDGVGVNVDLVDYALFANCWGENPLTNLNCACANLVEFDDHIIDMLDLYVLVELFLSSSEFYAPNNCSTSMTDPYAPSPDPMSFAIVPAAASSETITMTAAQATDISDVEYYFTNTAGGNGGNDSGWQDGRVFTDTGLTPETSYTYTVMARDQSPNQNATAPSAALSATTLAAGPSVWTSKATYAPNETIVVHFANAEGNSTDWVGLFVAGDLNTNYIAYKYTNGQVNGSVNFNSGLSPAGNYEARLFYNDSYTDEATTSFTVE